jgi:hypothetical protein
MANQSDTRTDDQREREEQNKGSQTSNVGEKGSQTSNQGNSGSTSAGSISHTMAERDPKHSGNQPDKGTQARDAQESHSGGKE